MYGMMRKKISNFEPTSQLESSLFASWMMCLILSGCIFSGCGFEGAYYNNTIKNIYLFLFKCYQASCTCWMEQLQTDCQ